MFNEKIKFTIEIDKNLYQRIQNAVDYANLGTQFNGINREMKTEQDFIIGSIVNFLEYVEVFAYPPKNVELTTQKKRVIKNTIKHYLKQRNIKQYELAEATGIEKGNLSMILNNSVQPSMDAFIRIWAALGYPPLDEILYRDEADG